MPNLEEESRCRLSFRLRDICNIRRKCRHSAGLGWMQQEEVPHLRKEKDRRVAAGRIMWDMVMICKTGWDPDMFLIA